MAKVFSSAHIKKIFLLLAHTPLICILPHLYGVSNSEQSMGRWFPKTAEEEQSYLPMLSFFLLLNYKDYWCVKKERFWLSAGSLLSTSRGYLRGFCSQPGSHFTKWPFRVSSGWLLCVISQARLEESSLPYFVLSILRRLKGHVSL